MSIEQALQSVGHALDLLGKQEPNPRTLQIKANVLSAHNILTRLVEQADQQRPAPKKEAPPVSEESPEDTDEFSVNAEHELMKSFFRLLPLLDDLRRLSLIEQFKHMQKFAEEGRYG